MVDIAPAETPIEVGTVWRDRCIPDRRLRITEVTALTVTFDVSYSTDPGAWDVAAHTRTERRRHWHVRFVPEVTP